MHGIMAVSRSRISLFSLRVSFPSSMLERGCFQIKFDSKYVLFVLFA